MYDKDGSGCIDKTELKEIVEVILTDSLIISESSRLYHTHADCNRAGGDNTTCHLHTFCESFCYLTAEKSFKLILIKNASVTFA